MNVELLERVVEAVLAEPKRVDMDHWLRTGHHDKRREGHFPRCGTVGCIAGWSLVHAERRSTRQAYRTVANKELRRYGSCDIEDLAAERLQLTESQSKDLFLPSHWPSDLQDDLYRETAGTLGYAQVVVRAIDRFIASGGNW